MRERREADHDQRASLERRAFLQVTGAACLAAWLGIDLAVEAKVPSPIKAPKATRRGILRLRLKATRLGEMGAFYGRTLGFPIEQKPRRLRVWAGGTELVFEPAAAGEEPIYHIAWAIPENKLAQAKAWMKARTPLLVHPDGRDEFQFRRVDRSAFYFADPAGNVLELIARHSLGDAAGGPFTLSDILYVNHAGLVVDDLPAAIRELETGLGLELRSEPTENFAQLGDEHRHVVLVTRKRLWLPELKVPAGIFDAEITLHGAPPRRLDLEGYPYRVVIEA
ncbi:MAG: hypothetical protein KDD47_01405 [Acidobacteria bacterium]|nr:hypothetical protein [Acidobacteriota bacterium]